MTKMFIQSKGVYTGRVCNGEFIPVFHDEFIFDILHFLPLEYKHHNAISSQISNTESSS